MDLLLKKHPIVYALTAGLIAITPTIQAGTTILNFKTLPSAQGWGYVAAQGTYPNFTASNVPESSVFSIINGIFTQNTIGLGSIQAIETYPADFSKPYTLRFTARLLATENGDRAAFTFGAFTNNKALAIDILNGSVVDDFSHSSLSIDTSIFHNYEIDADPAGGGYKLYIDGSFAFSASWVNYNYPIPANEQNVIYFGDSTASSPNGKAQISSLTFSQPDPQPTSVSVPLPIAAEWLLGLALTGFIGFSSRKPKKY